MRLFLYVILALTTTVFNSACSPPSHMLVKEKPWQDIRSIIPEKEKSALVVARTVSFGGAIEFDTYLDKKMIGVTQRKGYFIKTDVTPGVHYVISKAENIEPVKMQFEQGLTYYLLQVPRLGFWKARVSGAPVSPEKMLETLDDDVRQLEYNLKDLGDDLTDHDFEEAVQDYERVLKEGTHKDHLEYKGFQAKQ
jgi:hypothetical protein